MIRARSTRLVGSVRDREISSKRCRCSVSAGSAITRRGATTGSPNPIPHPPLTTSHPRYEVKRNILIFRNLYTSLQKLLAAWSRSAASDCATPFAKPQAFLAHQRDQRTCSRIEIAVAAMDQRHRDTGAHRWDVELLQGPQFELVAHAALRHQGQAEPCLDQTLLRGQAINQRDLYLVHPDRGEQPLQKAAERLAPARGRKPDPFLARQMPLRYPLADQPMLGRTDDPHRLDPDDTGDKLAALVGMIAQAERHLAAPYQIADLLAGRRPQIELDRNRPPGKLAQHVDNVGVREGTDEPQRHGSAGLADRRLHGLPPVLDGR